MYIAFQVQAEAENQDWPSIPVVAWIPNVLHVKGCINAVYQAKIIVSLKDLLATVVQSSIAEEVTDTTQLQILPMDGRQSIHSQRYSKAMGGPPPLPAVKIRTDCDGVVGLGKQEGFF